MFFSHQGRKPRLCINYIEAHTSIPNVGIRVIISITRQNVKKIPAIIVEGCCGGIAAKGKLLYYVFCCCEQNETRYTAEQAIGG